jgi:diguanylate cyclase (GGDEF) domain
VRRQHSGFGLFVFYAITTLIPIVILGVVLAQSFRTDLEHRGIEQGGAVAESVARSAIDPTLSGDSLADGPTPAERRALSIVAAQLLQNGDALQIRIRDSVGHIVFDPRTPERQPFGPADREVVDAIKGHPVRLLTRLNADEVDHAQSLGVRAVEVYTPISAASHGGRALGALEIYVPFAPIAASINDSSRHTTLLLVIGLLALWLILGSISWSVTRRLRRSAATNKQLARKDALTGLANRTAMADQLRHILASADPGEPVTVVTADLDDFSRINEVLGHENGDRFLCHIAARVRDTVAPTDTVARLGADEFGLVLPDTDARRAAIVIAAVRRALLDEVELGGIALSTDVTFGVVHGESGDDAGELLRRASLACRAAKRVKAPVLTYDESLEDFDADRLILIAELRHSIDGANLVLHYQPKVATVDGAVVGVEALLRWQHPKLGLLMPAAFLPAAESTELIIPLTDWVVDAACRQAATWHSEGRDLPIAVNVSARCLRDSAFADRVLATLMRYRLPAKLISIEVTETAVISDPARAAATLRRLAERGMSISIDDFGVGYTSLGHLDQLPIDEIKIDRQFVAPLVTGPDAGAVVRAVVSLGHELGMTVVAEGVEDDITFATLKDLGCDLAQGYGIARPAPVDQLEQWLATRVIEPANRPDSAPITAPV